ncbi:hypothetical protein [Vibrio alfacsensis]|uniref:hypothetical protein n=1 Tax=Vibrio alfacsensis TaxID=1074311 RepID=UPI0040675E48
MGFYTRILIYVLLIFVLASVIIYSVVDIRKERFEAPEIPMGSFEVHLFFDQQQNYR